MFNPGIWEAALSGEVSALSSGDPRKLGASTEVTTAELQCSKLCMLLTFQGKPWLQCSLWYFGCAEHVQDMVQTALRPSIGPSWLSYRSPSL